MGEVQRELQIRQRITAIFNKPESEFPGKKEYDDYLEEIEDIIYNLAEGIDVKETEGRVAAYQRANYENIAVNEARKAEETRKLAAKASQPEAPSTPADEGVAPPQGAANLQYAATADAPSALSRPAPAPMAIPGGPDDGLANDPAEVKRRIGIASGWRFEYPRQRALQEAFSSLIVSR